MHAAGETMEFLRPESVAEASATASWLELLESPCAEERGRRIPLDRELMAFGRDVHSQKHSFADLRMSRLHARSSWDARLGALRVADMESKNGTFVNGEAMGKPRAQVYRWMRAMGLSAENFRR